MIKKIGIIGANGQLNLEVCLLLSQMEGVQPIPICRNQVGASFLRRCGLDVRLGMADNEGRQKDVRIEQRPEGTPFFTEASFACHRNSSFKIQLDISGMGVYL